MHSSKLILVLFILLGTVSRASNWYVSSSGLDVATHGTTLALPFKTLKYAVSKAVTDGDIITVSGVNTVADATQMAITPTASITIQGINGAKFYGSPVINTVFISASNAKTLTLKNLIFDSFNNSNGTNNVAGAVLSVSGSAALIGSQLLFSNNKGVQGIVAFTGSSLTFTDCSFDSNTGLNPSTTTSNNPVGAIFAPGSSSPYSITIDRCLFTKNVGGNSGSALYIAKSTGNETILIQNSTFTNNERVQYPGGGLGGTIFLNAPIAFSNVKLINNTIAYNKNSQTDVAQRIYANAGLVFGGSADGGVTLLNNIIFSNNNSWGDYRSFYPSQRKFANVQNNITDQNITFANFVVAGGSNVGNKINVTMPQLDLENTLVANGRQTQTLKLRMGSIAVGAGMITGAPTVDQRMVNRLKTSIDIGAYDTGGGTTDSLANKYVKLYYNVDVPPYRVDIQSAQDPTSIITYNGSIYWVYVDTSRRMSVAKKTGNVVQRVAVFPLTMGLTDYFHVCPTIGVDKKGYLHLTGDMHNEPWKYFRSNNPEDISAWTKRTDVPGTGITYPTIYYDNDKNPYVLFRQRNLDSYGNHRAGVLRYNTNNDSFTVIGGTSYTENRPGILTPTMSWGNNFGGEGCWYTTPGGKIYTDANNRMHYACSMYNICVPSFNKGGSHGFESQTHMIYAYSDDNGVTWHKITGEKIASLPLTVSNASIVLDRTVQCDLLGAPNKLGAFSSNRPVIKYRLRNNVSRVIMWNGTSWKEISPPNLTPGLNFEFISRPDGLSAFVSVNSVYYSKDGSTWQKGICAYPNNTSFGYVSIDHEYFNQTGGIRYHGKNGPDELLTSSIITIARGDEIPTNNHHQIYVKNGGNDSTAIGTVDKPFASLKAAIGYAFNDGDTITVDGSGGVISCSLLDLAIKTIDKKILIRGINNAVVQGTRLLSPVVANSIPLFNLGSSPINLTLEDITFDNFSTDSSGWNTGSVLSCTGNTSIVNLVFNRVKFTNNVALIGGAVLCYSTKCSLTFNDCLFDNNTGRGTTAYAANGGALAGYDGTIFLNRCLFSNNKTDGANSALGSALRLRNTTKSVPTSYTIQNCTFANNSQNTVSGRAAIFVDAPATFINNTIAYNSSTVTCGGLMVSTVSGGVTLQNNIVFSNTPNSLVSEGVNFKDLMNNITDQNFDFSSSKATGTVSGNIKSVTQTNLKLASTLADNGGHTKTLMLNDESIAINAGLATGAPIVDQRNYTRIGIPSVGAYNANSITSYFSPANVSNDLFFTKYANIIVFKIAGEVKIVNMLGQVVKQCIVEQGAQVPLIPGTYIIHLKSNVGVKVAKVVF